MDMLRNLAFLVVLMAVAYGQMPQNFQCPRQGQMIGHIRSTYSTSNYDRVWDFDCRAVDYPWIEADCIKSSFVNPFGGELEYQCPENKFIVGFQSEYSHQYSDRRYKYRCCPSKRIMLQDCFAYPLNYNHQSDINYPVPRDRVLAGFKSSYNEKHKDRLWSAILCNLVVLPHHGKDEM